MLSEKNKIENTKAVIDEKSVETENTWTESFDFIKNKSLRDEIERYVTNPDNLLGKGGAAMVFSLEGQCIKLMKNRHNSDLVDMYNLGNTVENEFKIQGMLDQFEVDGVYSPMSGICFVGQENAAIVMEELHAVNLQMVLLGREELPNTFNKEDFCAKLESYIYEMHDLGIAHGDLFARNIMIDNETGLPRVIDFGRSMHSEDQNNPKFIKLKKDDLENLDKISLAIEQKL